MSKRNFLKKAFSKFVILALCVAFSVGMVACGNDVSSLADSGSGLTAPLTIWTNDGNVEKIIQKRLTGDYIDYSTYYGNKEFNVGVFQNETEGSNIILTAGKDINEYTIDFDDFTCGDNVLPKSAFTIYNQKYIENNAFEGGYGGGWYPDCLLPMDIAVKYKENFVKANTHQAIYITVTPSETQVPGEYSGVFTITADGKAYTVSAKITVFDFVLPTAPVADYTAGYSVDNLQAGELDSTLDMMETYYNFFLSFRCSPGQVPVHGSLSSSQSAFNTYMNNWIPQLRKYSQDERVGFINLPYVGNGVQITYETEKKDGSGKIIYKTDANGEYLLDDDGKKIPEMTEVITTQNVAMPSVWVNMLRRMCEESVDPNGDGIQSEEEFVNLFSKAATYFVYFDEFSSSAGKDLTAICTLQFVVYAAKMVGDEYKEKWTNGGETELTENQQAVIDSMLSIKHIAISTSPAPLQNSGYVKKMEFDMKDNATFSEISDWTKNYKYTDDEGNSLISYVGNRGTLLIQDFTECVFVTAVSNYSTELSREQYSNYAEQCQLYNHETWIYTAEGPKYPSVNNHLDTSIWGIRAMGWIQADYDATGNLYWSSTLCRHYVTVSPLYIDYLQDYYQTSERYRGTNGDGYLVYIGRPYETGPLGSIRMHAIRDANEDYDLLYYLEQYYQQAATDKGAEYSDEGFKNVLHTMTADLYSGTSVIKTTTDSDITNSRKLVASLLAMAKNTGAVVENYEIIEDTVRFTVSAPTGVEIKVNGDVKSGNTVGNRVEYVFSVQMGSTEKAVSIVATKDGVSESVAFSIEAVSSVSEAGSFTSTVLPTTVNNNTVDAGTTESVTFADGDNDVSAIKATFYSYYAYNVNGTHIKVDSTGDINNDYVAIDLNNKVVTIQKYTYNNKTGVYIAFWNGTLIKGADDNYYEFANSDADYYDKLYKKLNRYTFDGDGYVLNMVSGTYMKAKDGTYFEFDAEDIDTSSATILSYSLDDGVFVEDSNGVYMLKEGGDLANNNDYVKPVEGAEGKRYNVGTDRHQVEIKVESLRATSSCSLMSVKVYVEKDLEITVGGQVGTQWSYAATKYHLTKGWNEIQFKPSELGASVTRPVKAIRLRLNGVEENTVLYVGKIVVVK